MTMVDAAKTAGIANRILPEAILSYTGITQVYDYARECRWGKRQHKLIIN